MSKVYISIPISGYDLDEVIKKLARVKEDYLKGLYGDEWTQHLGEAITPIEINEGNKNASYPTLMGKDIEALLDDECDGILLCSGWRDSKGCRLEYHAACIYGKKILEERDNGKWIFINE